MKKLFTPLLIFISLTNSTIAAGISFDITDSKFLLLSNSQLQSLRSNSEAGDIRSRLRNICLSYIDANIAGQATFYPVSTLTGTDRLNYYVKLIADQNDSQVEIEQANDFVATNLMPNYDRLRRSGDTFNLQYVHEEFIQGLQATHPERVSNPAIVGLGEFVRSMALMAHIDDHSTRRSRYKNAAALYSSSIIGNFKSQDTRKKFIPTTKSYSIPELAYVSIVESNYNAARTAIVARALFPVLWALQMSYTAKHSTYESTQIRRTTFSVNNNGRFTRTGFTGSRIYYSNFVVEGLNYLRDEIVKSHDKWHLFGYMNNSLYNNHLSAHLMGLTAIGIIRPISSGGSNRVLDFVWGNQTLNGYSNHRSFNEMVGGVIMVKEDGPESVSDFTDGGPYPAQNIRERYNDADGDSLDENRARFMQKADDTHKEIVNGSIYDRYRAHEHKGIKYSMLQLELMGVTALMLENAGYSSLDFTASGHNSENLGMGFNRMAIIYNRVSSHTISWVNDKDNTVYFDDASPANEKERVWLEESGTPVNTVSGQLKAVFSLGRSVFCDDDKVTGARRQPTSGANLCSDDATNATGSRVQKTQWDERKYQHPSLGPINFLLQSD